jgi:hypothetical protein
VLANLFLPLSSLGIITPFVAIVVACVLFARHRSRVETARQLSVFGFILAVVVCGAIGGLVGLLVGIGAACPDKGNLCGLWGFLVTAPLFAAVGIVLAGVGISLIPARTESDE